MVLMFDGIHSLMFLPLNLKMMFPSSPEQVYFGVKVVMDSSDCPYIVQFYGAIFKEGDCWICMELMDSSLDKFYHFIFDDLQQTLPEAVIGELSNEKFKNYLKQISHLRQDHC